jgi:hypothetical protein
MTLPPPHRAILRGGGQEDRLPGLGDFGVLGEVAAAVQDGEGLGPVVPGHVGEGVGVGRGRVREIPPDQIDEAVEVA